MGARAKSEPNSGLVPGMPWMDDDGLRDLVAGKRVTSEATRVGDTVVKGRLES